MINILYLHAGAEMYGADKVLLDLIKGLDKKKFNPIIILPCEGVLVDLLRQEGVEVEVIPYPILRRKYFNPKGLVNFILSYLKYTKKVLKFVKNKNIGLLHINTIAVLEGIYIKKKLKVPIVWHVHEILISPKIVYKFISFVLGKYADKIVVVSKSVGFHLTESKLINSEKIDTIYNGVDNEIFNPNNDSDHVREELSIPKGAFVVGMIGRVNSWKGQDDFLSAIEKVMSQTTDTYATMIGGVFEGEEWRLKELKEKVASSPYKNRMIVSDYRKDSANMHSLIDIFVLPSTNPDPLPTVVLEAMATGKPVVGYRHGGICEMCVDGETGLLADVGNTDDLAEKICSLVNDRERLATMSVAAMERQKKMFSLNSYVDKFAKLYENLLRSGG